MGLDYRTSADISFGCGYPNEMSQSLLMKKSNSLVGQNEQVDHHKKVILLNQFGCGRMTLDYDESQMKDDDMIRRQQRSEIEYDC